MHPIEHLRYVARTTGADATLLARESASALSMFGGDPHALLTGAKSLLARQPGVGPLWWLCSHLLVAEHAGRAARERSDELAADGTWRAVADAIPAGSTVAIVGWPEITVRALSERADCSVLVLDVEGQGMACVRRLDRAEVEAETVDPARTAGVVEAADLVIVEAGVAGDAAFLTDVGGATLAAVAVSRHTPVWLVAGVGRSLPEAYWQEIVTRVVDADLPAFCQDVEVVADGLVDRRFGPGVDCPMLPELLRPVR